MKINQLIEEIANKDLTEMTIEELALLKKDLSEKEINASKITKVTLKKWLYNIVGWLCGIGIGACAARVLMSYLYSGVFDAFLPNLGIALVCGVPIAGTYIYYRIAKKMRKN